MQTTPKLGLKKPDLNDYVMVEDLNENADILDTAVSELQEGTAIIPDLETANKTLAGGINENKKNLAEHLAEKASLTEIGHTQLSNDIDSMDETKSATPKAVKAVKDSIPKLNDTITSNSVIETATANAVKQVSDKVDTHVDNPLPHRFIDGLKKYKYGLKTNEAKDGLIFVYEEVL